MKSLFKNGLNDIYDFLSSVNINAVDNADNVSSWKTFWPL